MADQQNSDSARAHENWFHHSLRENARLSQPASQTVNGTAHGPVQLCAKRVSAVPFGNLKREAQRRDVIITMSVVVCRLMGRAKMQATHWSHERHHGLNSLGDSERR